MHSLLLQCREVRGDVPVDFCSYLCVDLVISNYELLHSVFSVPCYVDFGFFLGSGDSQDSHRYVTVCCSAVGLLLGQGVPDLRPGLLGTLRPKPLLFLYFEIKGLLLSWWGLAAGKRVKRSA